ncbi:NADPH:quinone reductase-like Zn-dependent oxidoreductase [Paenibacillus sp. V4I3]|nr:MULTISPECIES: hypothetical protein [unclassified Paenibacillus]MDQ0878222.1 NADPH:quinone reductase-like Zn-dependent oxidoreductase [Paenibacillus sp. V4I3]MDQ0885951.1 NADPH:quinone reductase-like Zn-dependent oxidoreductase [Paenibacillus sp. V4I9]
MELNVEHSESLIDDSEFHLVDERIVGRKPSTLDFAQSAALPLTMIEAGNTVGKVILEHF